MTSVTGTSNARAARVPLNKDLVEVQWKSQGLLIDRSQNTTASGESSLYVCSY